MKATIYFKNSTIKAINIDKLISIKGRSSDTRKPLKNYDTAEKIRVFTPFADESYSFTGGNGTFAFSGADILYVELTEN